MTLPPTPAPTGGVSGIDCAGPTIGVFKRDRRPQVSVRLAPAPSGALIYEAGLAIDADGGRHAYRDDDKGLDTIKNACPTDRTKLCYGILERTPGDRVKQAPPNDAYYVSLTTLVDASKRESDPDRYVDSEQVAYVVLPLRTLARMQPPRGRRPSGCASVIWPSCATERTGGPRSRSSPTWARPGRSARDRSRWPKRSSSRAAPGTAAPPTASRSWSSLGPAITARSHRPTSIARAGRPSNAGAGQPASMLASRPSRGDPADHRRPSVGISDRWAAPSSTGDHDPPPRYHPITKLGGTPTWPGRHRTKAVCLRFNRSGVKPPPPEPAARRSLPRLCFDRA